MQFFVCLYPYMFASVKIKSRDIFCKKFGSRTKTLPNPYVFVYILSLIFPIPVAYQYIFFILFVMWK